MKRFISVVLAVSCIAILFMGQIHWNEKTSVSTTKGESKKVFSDTNKKDPDSKNKVSSDSAEYYLSFTKNWPAESVKVFKNKLEQGDPFKFTIVGSSSLGIGEGSWPEIVKGELNDTFGDHLDISILSYNLTSMDFITQNNQEDIIQEKPDLVLFEPFTLEDNGIVTIDDSLTNLTNIMTIVQNDNPEAMFVLQPPHPLFNANFYPIQVQGLQNFAENNGIAYLNHWEVWPDQTTGAIKEYLSEDSSEPSPKGHQLWADYVTDYFISKE